MRGDVARVLDHCAMKITGSLLKGVGFTIECSPPSIGNVPLENRDAVVCKIGKHSSTVLALCAVPLIRSFLPPDLVEVAVSKRICQGLLHGLVRAIL